MLKIEKKIIEWINQNMIYIALVFVVVSAAWMRIAGRNYMGNDYHYSLYDIPGNCNSLLYRNLANLLMKRSDSAIVLLKLLAYAGDFATAFLALALLHQKQQKLGELRTFFILTACLLSPVMLIYSVSGMRIDSVCMSLLLVGILFYRRNWILPATLAAIFAALLFPAYWPIAIMFVAYIVVKQKRKDAIVLTAACLATSFIMENSGDGNYFLGKIFVINSFTGEVYADFGQWLGGMCRIYGFFIATASLLLALKYRKLRIPALVLQILVIMYVGWQQTYFLAI